MQVPDVKAYSQDLNNLGIENQIVDHPTLKAIKEVLYHLGLEFSDCLPTLIMKADDQFAAVVFRGDCKVDFKKIKKILHISDLRMATPEEFTHLTGLAIGAARVYEPSVNMTIIDKKILEKEYLTGGSGSFSSSIKYKTSDLSKLPNSLFEDITQ